MFKIGDLLGRYRHITPTESLVRTATEKALQDVARVRVEPRRIKIVRSVVYLDTDAVTKSRIFMQRGALVAAINNSLARELYIKDIQ